MPKRAALKSSEPTEPHEAEDLYWRIRLANGEPPPSGNCVRCDSATGSRAPYYARLPLEEFVIWLPLCDTCVTQYVRLAREESQRLQILEWQRKKDQKCSTSV